MIQFTESDISAGASSQSFQRGSSYYRDGAVLELVQRGDVLSALVEGSSYDPYEVRVTLASDGRLASAMCSCPYDFGGYCKHVVAVLLAALHRGETVTVKPPLEVQLAGLSEAKLRRVILALAADQPGLVEVVEKEINWLTTMPAGETSGVAPAAPLIAVDLAAIRREMRKDFDRINSVGGGDYSRHYWDYDEAGQFSPDDVLEPHRTLALRLLDAGDAAAATDVICAMIDEWGEGTDGLDEWIIEGNEDVLSEAAQELDTLLAEALLSQDLSEEQRDWWLERISDWEDLSQFEIAASALEQWWDYPPLAAAMEGNFGERGAWEGEAPHYADELALVRLHVLERQGRRQEYIHLAEAEGQTSLYLNMLARVGQVERAVAEARMYLTQPDEVLALARVLVEQEEVRAALDVADHGLGVGEPWRGRELARWTVQQAQKVGENALALRAAQVAFLGAFALEDYKVVEALAGDEWPAIRSDLLQQMEQSNSPNKIDVYLHEQMLVEAMAVIDRSFSSFYLERVIEAARTAYPDWGIDKCKRQAEGIMNAGQAKHYDRAAAWLSTARDIYRQHGREAEWQAYLAGLLDLHARKYKLVPMLRAIRSQ